MVLVIVDHVTNKLHIFVMVESLFLQQVIFADELAEARLFDESLHDELECRVDDEAFQLLLGVRCERLLIFIDQIPGLVLIHHSHSVLGHQCIF